MRSITICTLVGILEDEIAIAKDLINRCSIGDDPYDRGKVAILEELVERFDAFEDE